MRGTTPKLASDFALLPEDIRRLLDELEHGIRVPGVHALGECTPPLDVYETDRSLEVRMDVPGLDADALQVVFTHGVLIIAGAKAPAGNPPSGSATFHLVEREFGCFARAIRLTGALDIARARAHLLNGELRVVMPKIGDRRGAELRIPVETGPAEPGA
jgi:HSP20 family protein